MKTKTGDGLSLKFSTASSKVVSYKSSYNMMIFMSVEVLVENLRKTSHVCYSDRYSPVRELFTILTHSLSWRTVKQRPVDHRSEMGTALIPHYVVRVEWLFLCCSGLYDDTICQSHKTFIGAQP